MPDLDELRLAQLARELVMNIRNYKLVFADYGIDETDYYEIEKNEFFKKIKDQYTIEWNSSTSTEDRLKIGSLAYLERLFPELTRRALDANEALPAATGVASLLMKTAGVGGDSKPAANMAERFVITINLGADVEGKEIVEKYNKSVDVNPNDIDPGKLIGDSHGKTDHEGAQGTAVQLVRKPRGRPRKIRQGVGELPDPGQEPRA